MTYPEGMTMKPGTRCECRETHSKHLIHATQPWRKYDGPQACQRDAVRLVTVRTGAMKPGKPDADGMRRFDTPEVESVPLCAACAEHAEAEKDAR